MWQFYINGIEQIDKAISATASTQLDRQNNTFSVNLKDIHETYHFLESVIRIDGEDIVSGIITGQRFKDKGSKRADLTVEDHYYILQRRCVAERYTDMTVSDILIHALTKYAPEFSTAFIDPTPKVVASFPCDYIYLSELITKLIAYLPGWHYYIDADRAFHLFETYEADGVRFEPVDGKWNYLRNSLEVDYEAENVVSRVWVIGAKQAAEQPITQYFTGDGQNRYFTLAYEPNYAEVYLDDVLKNSLLDSNDDGAQDFLISKTGKALYIPANIETPFTGEIKIVYRPTMQYIDYFARSDADNPYLLEAIIKNKDVANKLETRGYGKAEIQRRRSIQRTVRLKTYEKVWIGQRHYVKDPDYDVDGFYLATKVSVSFPTVGRPLFTVTLEEIT